MARALLEDSDGRLWVGTNGGLNLPQEESGSFARYHPDPSEPESLGSDHIVSLYQDRTTFGSQTPPKRPIGR